MCVRVYRHEWNRSEMCVFNLIFLCFVILQRQNILVNHYFMSVFTLRLKHNTRTLGMWRQCVLRRASIHLALLGCHSGKIDYWLTVFCSSCVMDLVQSVNSEVSQWRGYSDILWMTFLATCRLLQNIVIFLTSWVKYRDCIARYLATPSSATRPFQVWMCGLQQRLGQGTKMLSVSQLMRNGATASLQWEGKRWGVGESGCGWGWLRGHGARVRLRWHLVFVQTPELF